MLFKVTEKIGKSEIVLPTVSYSLKSGHTFTVPDDKVNNSDVQYCISSGYIEQVGENVKKVDDEEQVTIKNISSRKIKIAGQYLDKNQIHQIPKSRFESSDITLAIETGLIEIVEDKVKSKKSHSKKEVVKKIEKTEKVDEVEVKEENDDDIAIKDMEISIKEAISKDETMTINPGMGAWDPHAKKMLNKEESASKVIHKLDTPRVQVGNVDFARDDFNKPEEKSGGKTIKRV